MILPKQNFNLEIIKLKHLNVDAIGVCLNTGQVPTYMKQLSALKYEGAIFGCNAISSPEVLKALEEYKYNYLWYSKRYRRIFYPIIYKYRYIGYFI